MNNKILFKISSIIGLIYIIFIIWLRLIRERLPKDINTELNSYTFYLYVLFLILSLCMFVYYIRKILNIHSKYKLLNKILELPLIRKYTDVFLEYILKAPFNSYLWIYNNFDLNKPIGKIGAHIWNRDPYKDPQYFAFILCILKVIISLCFITDIIILHQFNYFYKSLIILFVILFCNCFIFIIKDVSKEATTFIEANVLIIFANKRQTAYVLDFHTHFKGLKYTEKIHDVFNHWVYYTANCMFADKFYEYYHKYNKYTSVIYYGIFSLGWSYILLIP